MPSAEPRFAGRGRAAPRRLLPWAAFLLLFVAHGLASRAGGAEAERAEQPAPRAGSGDVPDTHRRLDEIYKRLGIKREVPTADDEDRGCKREGCGCKREGRDSGKASPQMPEFKTPAMPPFLGYVLIGAVILAILVPLALSLRSSYRRSSQTPEAGLDEEAAPVEEMPRGPWQVDLAECRRLLEAGRLAEAFAALHRAFLLSLAAQRHLVIESTTTNWEYVRRLSSRPQLRQTLAAVTAAAEASVLGQRPPTRDHYVSLEGKVLAATREAVS